MKKHIFIVTRYSLLSEKASGSWKIGRERPFESYKAALFAPERMEQHQQLFHNVTLKSLLAQKPVSEDVQVTWLIVTSVDLPAPNKAYLENLTTEHPWIKPLYLSPQENLGGGISSFFQFAEDTCFMTLRLDDDDALALNFLRRCESYLHAKFAGFALTFGKGYQATFEAKSGQYQGVEQLYYPKIAIGLGLINVYRAQKNKFACPMQTVYAAGNHTKIDEKLPMLTDSREPAFLRSLHTLSDTQGKVSKRKVVGKASGDPLLAEYFPFLAFA